MDLHTWLDAEAGRATALASSLGIGKAAVSFWRDGGVPLVHMERVASLTDGAVTVADMVEHAIACKQARRTEPAKA